MNFAKWIVPAAAIEAAAAGLIATVSPSLFAWLILGAELSEAGQAMGRLTGIAMLGYGLAAWPAPATTSHSASAVRVLLIYNLLATIYLVYLGIDGRLVGIPLWPAAALHAILSFLLVRSWLAEGEGSRI